MKMDNRIEGATSAILYYRSQGEHLITLAEVNAEKVLIIELFVQSKASE